MPKVSSSSSDPSFFPASEKFSRTYQVGPLVSYAFTKSLEDVAGQISVDNDLLMRALSSDMTSKGVIPIANSPMRIQVRYPKGIVVKTKTAQVSGQVIGIDQSVELHWSLNGAADEDDNGLVTTGEIIEYVRSKVLEATKGKQHPDPAGQYDRKLPLAVVEQQ